MHIHKLGLSLKYVIMSHNFNRKATTANKAFFNKCISNSIYTPTHFNQQRNTTNNVGLVYCIKEIASYILLHMFLLISLCHSKAANTNATCNAHSRCHVTNRKYNDAEIIRSVLYLTNIYKYEYIAL